MKAITVLKERHLHSAELTQDGGGLLSCSPHPMPTDELRLSLDADLRPGEGKGLAIIGNGLRLHIPARGMSP